MKKKSQKDLTKISIKNSDSLGHVISVLAKSKPNETLLPAGIALVVDQKNVLLGIVTDGDIRRALAGGATLDTKVSLVMNKNPFLIEGPKNNVDILSLITEKIKKEKSWHKHHLDKIIIVDSKRKVIDLLDFYDLWQSSDVRFKSIGIVGLGYVGLTLGLVFADLGFKVKGYDTNISVADSIRKSKPHFFEKGLHSLLKVNLGKNFNVVSDFEGTNNCDVYCISVGTPLNKDKKPNYAHLESAAKNLGKVLKPGDLIMLRSTVPTGTTRKIIIPILEKESGLVAGEDFLVAFAPERTIEGKAIEELRVLPQVVGGMNRASAEAASNIFSAMTKSIVLLDSLEEAEMVKLINNSYRDVTFAFANEVSLIARRFDLDTKKIIQAANFGYERSNVPFPSPGVGGYCLEKDPFIFINSAEQKGYTPKLLGHARNVSDLMLESITHDIEHFLKKEKKDISKVHILIMGFAFKGKPSTSDIRGSTTYSLIEKLQKRKIKNIIGYDPFVRKEDIEKAGVIHVDKLANNFKKADVIVIMNNNPHFEEIDLLANLSVQKRPILFVDTWSAYPKEEVKKLSHVKHYRL